jgi:anti-anti-sigma factor
MSSEQLRIRSDRRDRICVVALSGPLDVTAAAGLTQCIEAERAARPARLVIDMSGISVVDFNGARALAAAVRPVPGQCPVVVRSVRPAARQRLELAGLDLAGPDHGAATLLRLAARRPAAAARLEMLSQAARSYAAVLRGQRPEAPPPAPPRQLPAVSGTAGRAVAFIEERARDDIGITDIAAAAFVTVRAVQLAFRHYLDMTPMTYLRQVRLDGAHDELLAADPGCTTVTAVAADWHFTNASRFSAYYRAAYGVAPAHTLRQAPPGD